MSHHRSIWRFPLGGLLAAATLFAADVWGQTIEGFFAGSNQPPRLAARLCSGELVGHEQVIRQLLSSGTNKFVFVVPAGLRTEAAPEGGIALTSGDMSYFVSLRFVAHWDIIRDASVEVGPTLFYTCLLYTSPSPRD